MKKIEYEFKDIFIVWGLWAIGLNLIKKVTDAFRYNFDFSPKTFFVTTYLFSYILLFCLIYLLICKKYKISLQKEFSIEKISFKNTFVSILIAFLMAAFLIKITDLKDNIITKNTYFSYIYYIIVSSTIGPFVEELFSRGVIYNYLIKKTNIIFSIIIINIWFVIAHLHLNKENMILFLISIFIIGSIFTLERYYYKNLVPSIISHAVFNLLTGLYTLSLINII